MAGRIRHDLGLKARGNVNRKIKIGLNEFQRLLKEGWTPEFLAYPDDPRIGQIRELSRQEIFLGKPFEPKTGIRLDNKKVLVWIRGPSSFQRLTKAGWKPRFLTKPNDPWIKQETELGIQPLRLSEPFQIATGARINDDMVLVWTR